MKLYAYTTPDIPKNAGYLKIGETHGDVEKRVQQQIHEQNIEKIVVWQDAVITERSGIDKILHRYLKEQGFHVQQFTESGKDTELVKCTVGDIEKAFAIIKQQLYDDELKRQALGDKFYREIRNWYYWTTETNKKVDSDTALRLVVRLLFCYFLREKDALVPGELFDKNFIQQHLKEDKEYSYYNAILRNLFFHCLNTPMTERKNIKIEHENLLKNSRVIKEQFSKIPFLNGGLFDEHTGDDVPIGNDYFFSEKRERHITELGENCDVSGLIRILSRYHYRLTLDDLLDREKYVETVDPEFIGKVFESLLACIDADSKESRRKVTGSYYTPREIVDYMVSEALDAYCDQSRNRKIALGDLQSYDCGSVNVSVLLQCKILDPACGSGAFPCGIMNEIMRRLDPNKELSQLDRYHTKLKIIQDVIYGVDIQPIAVQISQLRLFLSLIQDIIPDKRKTNYGIETLPNLETKFVCADSLIGLKKAKNGQGTLELPRVKEAIRELQKTRSQYFMASNVCHKESLRQMDESWRKILAIAMEDAGALTHGTAEKLVAWNPYDSSHSAPFFDSVWMFGVEKFDIVIGNPPYGAKYPHEHEKYFKEHYVSTKTIAGKQKGSLDTFSLFIENGFNAVKTNGTVGFIVSIAFTSSDSMSALHNLLFQNCEKIAVSNYMDRPIQIFENAHTPVSVLFFTKTGTPCKTLLTTKRNRRKENEDLNSIIKQLEFVNSVNYVLYGRIPRVGKKIETSILKKLFSRKNVPIGKMIQSKGSPIYYRTGGGDYFKVFTDYATGSTQEKPIYFDKDIASVVGAFLSSNLFWWFQNIYADGRHIKRSEIEQFRIPLSALTDEVKRKIRKLYAAYLADIEKNANVRIPGKHSSYKVDSFKEYKLVYSKPLIDRIDDLICPLYGLTDEEKEFIKNYELEFRMRGE